jgi:hypothetical protein
MHTIGPLMAKLTDLVSCVADITGVPEATVREISRRLREAGLISTGKVGRYGGADMTPTDAASLLTGMLVASTSSVAINDLGSVTKSHLNFKSYFPRRRPPLPLGKWSRELSLPLLCCLQKGHRFNDALSALITSAANGDIERATKKWRGADALAEFRLAVRFGANPFQAEIEFQSPAFTEMSLLYLRPAEVRVRNIFVPAAPRKWSDLFSRQHGYDFDVSATIHEETVAAVGRLLQEEVP